MKKLTEAVLAIGAVISLSGPAAAQGIYLDLGPGPGPRKPTKEKDARPWQIP
jgi:hypothetical protein